ncbi:MAG: diguanylate cyclase [Alphaproteobacteria bacterium]|uniref:diguanylate cyclase n=1 Tax=Candidatus Nitrobium versatile TaxID=2884831 RepID=A0A953M2J8_9BACT|nr:diguanylate cyclase [Candidatus Nitrobium versatile]
MALLIPYYGWKVRENWGSAMEKVDISISLVDENRSGRPQVNYFRVFLYVSIVFLMGSLDVLIGSISNTSTAFFTREHLISGGTNALVTSILIFALALYVNKLERSLGEQKRVEKELKLKQQQLEMLNKDLKVSQEYAIHIIDSSLDMIITVNRERKIVGFNMAAEKTFGYRAEEVIGKHVDILYSDKEESAKIYDSIVKTGQFIGEIINRRRDGEVVPSFLSASILRDTEGNFLGVMGISRDITELKRAEEALRIAATVDRLTGALNRQTFEDALGKETERAKRYGSPLSLLMFDIDRFKGINDTYGHQTGDSVLRTVSSLVRENIRSVDFFGRWGGEEFMVLLPETSLEDAVIVAEKLRKLLENHSFSPVPRVTASFGVAQCHEQEAFDSLTKRTDTALYRAKNRGRNRVETES